MDDFATINLCITLPKKKQAKKLKKKLKKILEQKGFIGYYDIVDWVKFNDEAGARKMLSGYAWTSLDGLRMEEGVNSTFDGKEFHIHMPPLTPADKMTFKILLELGSKLTSWSMGVDSANAAEEELKKRTGHKEWWILRTVYLNTKSWATSYRYRITSCQEGEDPLEGTHGGWQKVGGPYWSYFQAELHQNLYQQAESEKKENGQN